MGIIAEADKKLKKKLTDTFDYNYSAATVYINSEEDFMTHLYAPFSAGERIYYRGERVNDERRILIPSLLRSESAFRSDFKDGIVYLNNRKLYDFYKSKPNFVNVYKTMNGNFDEHSMYKMLAFAQHYLHISPLIDFTKSLYVALSFALKNKTVFNDDPVIYTVFDVGHNDTSDDIREVNKWIEDYNVAVLDHEHSLLMRDLLTNRKHIREKNKSIITSVIEHGSDMAQALEILGNMYPQAKLIDIPTNDLMKYQQGVFLLLNRFTMVSSKYLTKSVRQSFIVNKYVINKSICPRLKDFLLQKAPHYKYDYLLSISKAVEGC